jgi:putative phage-type endonuclease
MKIIKCEQGTEEWLKMRLGKVTGTRLKSVMGTKAARETLIYELVAEQLSGVGESVYVNDAMRWGTDHEDEAIELYGKKVKKVGFCISDEFPFLGLSPDALRGKTGAVEVKCPSTKVAIKYMSMKTVPKEYLWQVVNYYLVCETLKTLDFVVYDPRIINPKLKLTVIPTKRKDFADEIAKAKESLVDFRKEWEAVYNAIDKK